MNEGTCPACNGSKVSLGRACYNCGGQTMSGKATGLVAKRADGQPCLHEYKYKNKGRCLHEYTCAHCGYSYLIDSSD
jgi:hypothetical protein